jgi:hypothetical protein
MVVAFPPPAPFQKARRSRASIARSAVAGEIGAAAKRRA